ncbi:ImuA family protein [Amorphus orientalis]|nr:hypothetical protein [Amorphus orientalis]
MSWSILMAADPLADLRARIAGLEGRREALVPTDMRGNTAAARFSVDVLERLYPLGGPPEATVHDLACEAHRDAGALTGFAAALIARMGSERGGLVWISDGVTAGETGALYGPGLAAFGLDPGRLVSVTAKSAADALWAAEEALGVSGLAAVVAEIGGTPRALDLTATRRLALRAERQGTPLFLLRPAGPDVPSAARVRLRLKPRPSAADPHGLPVLGSPGFAVTLSRNRGGPTGAVDVELSPHDHRFHAVRAPHPVPLAAETADRPPRPGPAEILPLRTAS